jgi:hypothetical protein
MSKRVLKDGAPRLLGHHGGAEGVAYQRHYQAIKQAFGPFESDLLRYEAGRLAVARMQFERATAELTTFQKKRRTGKGRRPNERLIERLARRQGLADQTLSTTLARFEALARANGKSDLARSLQRAMVGTHNEVEV